MRYIRKLLFPSGKISGREEALNRFVMEGMFFSLQPWSLSLLTSALTEFYFTKNPDWPNFLPFLLLIILSSFKEFLAGFFLDSLLFRLACNVWEFPTRPDRDTFAPVKYGNKQWRCSIGEEFSVQLCSICRVCGGGILIWDRSFLPKNIRHVDALILKLLSKCLNELV